VRKGFRLEYLSAGWMSVEAAGTLAAGLLAGSVALLAFGGDSLIEMLSAVAVLGYLRADTGGPRAQGRNAAKLTTALLFSLIPVIGFAAIFSAVSGVRPDSSPLGVAIAAGAVLLMPYLWLEKRRIGRVARCLPLSIDALESATCFFMAAALLAALLVEWLVGLRWVDYVATAVILGFVAVEAAEAYGEVREGGGSVGQTLNKKAGI
jgi:divalent metal cation (Fe/Co/Zn/Cd) transporter